MAGTFLSTGVTFSNLSRLELEQLRKADFFAGGKALTVGDDGTTVGPGSINAEPFFTDPSLVFTNDVISLTPPTIPGRFLGTLTQTADLPSETIKWFGPTHITDGLNGQATAINTWTDNTVNFTILGVQPGDILLVRESSFNASAVGTVSVVGVTTLTLININNPTPPTNQLTVDAPTLYSYIIVRPNAIQLFAVPGSGPTGREQTFLAVIPGSTLHNTVGPTTDQINLDRVKALVPTRFALDATVDRADGVFDSPGPRTTLDGLGYRIVLYPDNGLGTGPNLAAPITSLTPVIDPAIPPGDQRFTVDTAAGVIRFSCAPALGGQIKVPGGVNAITGRLNLYAVFWSFDQTITGGTVSSLYVTRSDQFAARTPATVRFDGTQWLIGSSGGISDMFVLTLPAVDDVTIPTKFGVSDITTGGVAYSPRYFVYRQGVGLGGHWKMLKSDTAFLGLQDPVLSMEMEIGDKTEHTVGDITAPPMSPADFTPRTSFAGGAQGARNTDTIIDNVLNAAIAGGYGVVHLRRGRYFRTNTFGTIHLPPGIILEGEGQSTIIESKMITGDPASTQSIPLIKVGPNTTQGVYEAGNPVVFNDSGVPSTGVEGADIVWNPVRRVWAVVHADVTLGAVFFNEVHPDGSTTFPGHGIDIKNNANVFFTSASVNSDNHTPGHYPRIAHHAYTDVYALVWVEEYNPGSGIGPRIQLQPFQVILNPATPVPNDPRLVPQIFYYARNPITGGGSFIYADHPSIAVDNGNPNIGGGSQTITISCWGYGPGLVSTAFMQIWTDTTFGFTPLATAFPTQTVISSTDVADDGVGGFMYVWSRRHHPVIRGTASGSVLIDGTGSYLSDPGFPNWSAFGVQPGSRFMYLGTNALPAGAFYNLAFGLIFPICTPYGVDGVIYDTTTNPSHAYIKQERWGISYVPATVWTRLQSNKGSTSIGGITLTDTSVNFVAAGIQVGDYVMDSLSPLRVATVAPTTITVSGGTFSGNFVGNFSYVIQYGQPINYAIIPQSFIEGMRYAGGLVPAHNLPSQTIAGADPAVGSYKLAQIEPDMVRISKGQDNWLVVYQHFKTTSFFANAFTQNFSEGTNFSTFIDNAQALTAFFPNSAELGWMDAGAPYREHVSTCAIVLNDRGNPVYPFTSEANQLNPIAGGQFDMRASRDIEISQRSLGTRPWITARPNYAAGINRRNDSFAVQVSALNYHYRWNAGSGAGGLKSIIPDVTWSGTDWTIVSPIKSKIHGYTGNYFVTGTGAAGQVYFADPSFYFGSEAGNTVDGNIQRGTVHAGLGVGDQIFFPSAGVYGTIQSINSEHVVQLVESNAALLNVSVVPGGQSGAAATVSAHVNNTTTFTGLTGMTAASVGRYLVITGSASNNGTCLITAFNSATSVDVYFTEGVFPDANSGSISWVEKAGHTINVEWYLVKNTFSNIVGGFKNAGFRVAPDGRLVVSSRYLTMADEVTDRSRTSNQNDTLASNRTVLMRRSSFDFILGLGSFTPDGSNVPQTLAPDGIPQDSRYTADIGFSGVAPGRVKGCNELVPNESPIAAVAWGETMFACVDRTVAGDVSNRENLVTVHRQSFGPYNNGIRNLKLLGHTRTQFTNVSTWNQVKTLTRHKVYTRHGTPNVASAFFATDGIRNCYGTHAADHFPGSSTVIGAQQMRITTWYTDAFGRDPIQMHGPEAFQNRYHGEVTSDATLLAPLNASSPKMHWNGSNFVGVWTEGSASSENTNMLCLGIFPGDEDAGLQGAEMVAPDKSNNIQPYIAKIAAIPETRGSSITVSSFTTTSVAYSGRVYCVAWVSGLDLGAPSTGVTMVGVTLFDSSNFGAGFPAIFPPIAGSTGAPHGMPFAVGSGGSGTGTTTFTDAGRNFTSENVQSGYILVIYTGVAAGRYLIQSVGTTTLTLFSNNVIPTGSGYKYSIHRPQYPGGGTTYVIANGWQGGNKDAFNSPRVVWDGNQFVVAFVSALEDSGPTVIHANSLQYVMIPETGPHHPWGLLRVSATQQYDDQTVLTDGIGFLETGTSSPTRITLPQTMRNTPSVSARGYHPQVKVGDILVVTQTKYDAGSANAQDAGWYVINSVNYATSQITCGHTFATTAAVTTAKVRGAIISMGQGDDINLTAPLGNVPSDSGLRPRYVMHGMFDAFIPGAFGGSINRVHAFIHNETTDEYAVLFQAGTNLSAVSFKKGLVQASPESLLYGSAVKVADMAWNGRNYCAVWVDEGTQDVNYAILGPNLNIEDNGFVSPGPGTDPVNSHIGNGLRQAPGPLHSAYRPSIFIDQKIRAIRVIWNHRLNRWVVTASVLWHRDTAGVGGSNELAQAYNLANTTVASINQNLITLTTNVTDNNFLQPGCKWVDGNTGNFNFIAEILTVTNTGGTAPVVGLDTTNINSGWTGYAAGSFYVLPREDCFTWTLGYDNPVIQIEDADDVTLEDIEIQGTVDIEEKYLRMARPTWQAAGPIVGRPSQIDGGLPSIARPPNYNHRFMHPEPKVQVVRQINVRSHAKYKHGPNHFTPPEKRRRRGG